MQNIPKYKEKLQQKLQNKRLMQIENEAKQQFISNTIRERECVIDTALEDKEKIMYRYQSVVEINVTNESE